jgi:hypothetical protein
MLFGALSIMTPGRADEAEGRGIDALTIASIGTIVTSEIGPREEVGP